MPRDRDPDLLLLQAIADHTRLAILRQLSTDGPTCACDLTACCGVGQSTVSHHLKVLREAGWVEAERRGSWIWYSLRAGATAQLRGIADSIRPDGVTATAAPGASVDKRPAQAPREAATAAEATAVPATAVPGRRPPPVAEDSWRQW